MDNTTDSLPSFTINTPENPPASNYTVSVNLAPEPNSVGYNIELCLHERFNELKARLLNLVEAAVADTRQCNAVKGLVKDVVNQAYYGSLRMIDAELEFRGLGDKRGQNCSALNAKGLSDILVD